MTDLERVEKELAAIESYQGERGVPEIIWELDWLGEKLRLEKGEQMSKRRLTILEKFTALVREATLQEQETMLLILTLTQPAPRASEPKRERAKKAAVQPSEPKGE